MNNTTLLTVTLKKYDSYDQAKKDLINQGCKDLGWLNGGITLPKTATFVSAFSNRSGTQCLYCDITHRLIYSVDMGD